MDPNNIHSQSSSLLGLLHSQQGSVYHENFPHESFHGRINFGDSQPIPSFSSQPSQVPPVARGVRRKWDPADDEVLISAWLNTSKDSIVANEQKSGTFWDRVAHLYSSSPHGLEDGEREPGQCKKRWHRINDDVNKFCAAYSASERQLRSGESDTDLLKKAHEIFFADQAKKFTFEHAWCTLRFEQKWLSLNAPKAGGGEKRKNVETTTQASTTDGVVDVDPRPEGIKAAKARRNGGKGKSVSDYASVWEMKKEDWKMKKEDLERKERLSKLSILDTLLAKTEPLSEAEEAVKNKLLAECF
ncbi:glutathione S-transferase T3-like [Brassica napus]|nr:glutathione S-transferase T3-like [Brassica napus]